jgi:SM-20-related protein
LENIFNTLIDKYIDEKVGIAEHFLSQSLSESLKTNLTKLYAGKQLLAAKIGSNKNAILSKDIRSDMIYWLDKAHNDPFENAFFDLMDSFVLHLNNTCYTGISGYEFHYTMYEPNTFYKKHIDQFQNNNSRKFSMIIYLNENWQQGDGGELCIYHDNAITQIIAPMNGTIVFFKSSELPHEVLMNNKTRMSITGWLKSDSL